MIKHCRFAFVLTTFVIVTGINSKSAASSQFISSKLIYSQQLVAQSSTPNNQTEGVFNNEPMTQEKTSDTQISSGDSDFYNLFTPILCTLLGYAAGSIVGGKNQRERVREHVSSEN